jgi:hypothetical protein
LEEGVFTPLLSNLWISQKQNSFPTSWNLKRRGDNCCMLIYIPAGGNVSKCPRSFFCYIFVRHNYPVRIRVRIVLLRPLVCRKRRLNGAVLWMRLEKWRSHVTARVAR